ncbi:predicted protein [Histoplasma capsulatum G186AR]|uniref:Uncharacterized protein n=1 Tax=Ajellomyces capsulatus (strain G186AR / H82 / ATCC MYA-2454 / RMSCC 2432) TaxID=447093 RepID=C0NVB0_AJECG|nr:uncharacterized protein HCBG_07090 [Histoplasma capsulatum G186AR]EEH04449.1 predicted protein [Histoplasma capsulatum G186AR]
MERGKGNPLILFTLCLSLKSSSALPIGFLLLLVSSTTDYSPTGSFISPNLHSQERLDGVVDVTYLGQSYFEPEAVDALTVAVVGHDGETLKERIDRTLEERLSRPSK